MSFKQLHPRVDVLQAGEATLRGINFTGGFPTSQDFAPSTIFLALYILMIPVLLWRLGSPQHRSMLLLRPAMFQILRIASLVLRAVMSKRPYTIGMLIAELVLISVGYLFLIEPAIMAWKRVVAAHTSRLPRWVEIAKCIMLGSLIGCIVIFVVSGILAGQIYSHPNVTNVVHSLREASYILSLVLCMCLAIIIILSSSLFHLPTSRVLFLMVPTCCLITTGAYRVAQTFSENLDSPARSLVAFWVLQISVEFITYVSFLAISLPEWFPNPQKKEMVGV